MEKEIEKIINLFKEANQNLRKRAISIGILLIISISLTYTETRRLEDVMSLINYQYKLKEINSLSDSAYIQVIEGDNDKYFPPASNNNYEYIRLFERVKFNKFDRTLIEKAIDDAESKIEEVNKGNSINIIGLNIPLGPVTYMGVVIILILFHDFTQIITFRNQIQRKIRKFKIPDWELGFELFGSYNNKKDPAFIFLRLISSMISGILIICPLITSFLILELNNSNSDLLSFLNIFCFSVIITDTVIILYTENVWNFRFYSNIFLTKRTKYKSKKRMIWLTPMILLCSIHIGIATAISSSILISILYFMLVCLPLILLFVFLERTYENPTKSNRIIRAALLIVNVFWIYIMFSSAFGFNEWGYDKIQLLLNIFFIALGISLCVSFIYIKYFKLNDNKTKILDEKRLLR